MKLRAGGLVDAVEGVGEFVVLGWASLIALFTPPVRFGAFVNQVHRQGVRALWLATVSSLFYGMVLAFQMGSGLKRFGALALLPEVTTIGLLRELIPVLVGLVIGGRLAAGIAAELASMAVTEQLDAVRVLGADPVRELYAPRIAAATFVLPLVTIFGDLIATVGAMILASSEYRMGPRYYLDGTTRLLTSVDFLSGLLKAAIFGAVMAVHACRQGSRAHQGADAVGQATTRAVVYAALSVIVLDFFISRVANFIR